MAEAAIGAGIGITTLVRWMQLPDFREEYRLARRAVVGQAVARLQRAASQAVTTLENVMDDDTALPSARVSAAKAVLELALRSVELDDLGARIEALEQAATAADGGVHR